jgi:hypothetical protein
MTEADFANNLAKSQFPTKLETKFRRQSRKKQVKQ